MPCSDGLPGGMGGVFGRVGFCVTGGGMGIERKLAYRFHPQRAPVFGPFPDGIDCGAWTLVARALMAAITVTIRGRSRSDSIVRRFFIL